MSWYFNRRVSTGSQPSLCVNPVTLVLRRWSFSVNRAAVLGIFCRVSMAFCVYAFHAMVPYSSFDLTCRPFLCLYVLQGGESV